jgi:hypothetical protein
MTESRFDTEWHGLHVSGILVRDDWEGDASIPNGTHTLPPYFLEYRIELPDGTDAETPFTFANRFERDMFEQELMEAILD